MKCITISFSNV